MASEQRDTAVQRLEAALVERDRLGERFDAAVGTSTEFGAYVRLRAADAQVRAREVWLNWVDDGGYRGLNAGPFELLAESRGTRCTRGLEGWGPWRAQSDTAQLQEPHDGGVSCTAPMATAGLGRSSRPDANWPLAEFVVVPGWTATRSAVQIFATCTLRLHTTKQAA
jgi:hypothetical protein